MAITPAAAAAAAAASADPDNNNNNKKSESADITTTTTIKPKPKTTLHSLPPELHVLISQHLIYPDALSLKHTCAYFYRTVDTGIRLKVDWLVERRSLHLECPNDRRCDLGSDLKFCRGSVPLLMQRRREHMECESREGLGCLVFGTERCLHRGKKKGKMGWKRRSGLGKGEWLRARVSIEVWWVLVAVLVATMAVAVAWVGGTNGMFSSEKLAAAPGFSFLGGDW